MCHAVILALCLGLAFSGVAGRLSDATLDAHWEMFKSEYGKAYADSEEELTRRLIWEDHVALIARHNREYDMGIHTFNLGINQFADMSNAEFVRSRLGFNQPPLGPRNSGSTFMVPNNVVLPKYVDWRTQGYVTPVKDQGQCGSSWAYGAITSLEGQHFKASGQLIELSVQNMLDCSVPEGNQGCSGGFMDNGFTYVKKNGGIDTESSYPYEGKDGKCRFNKATIGATDTGFVDIKKGNETDLQVALATVGPVSGAVDASQVSFQMYKSGVYNDPGCSLTPNHGIAVVGYGVAGGKDFWIVKNSWGPKWGEQGYIRMSRNAKNQCGIATVASYPLV